ncbi:MAG: type III PLP-dependent enzyme [Maricaulaceae bacterium]
MDAFDSPLDLVGQLAPEVPVVCARPHKAARAARWFLDRFPGRTCFAIKANPAPWTIAALGEAGLNAWEVAGEAEIATLRQLGALTSNRHVAFMHPVKSRRAIRRAYFDYDVRAFALDCDDELSKILVETDNAKDLTLIIRIAVDNSGAILPLAGKFGASAFDAPQLLQRARAKAARLGVSFHVGSQCMAPEAYRAAMAECSRQITRAGVTVDIVNVGGGFPALYPGFEPPPLETYLAAIATGLEEMNVTEAAEVWCEPGRALVAEAESLVVRVELRKGDALYLNDGAFGRLFDGAFANWRYPVRLLRPEGEATEESFDFRLFGPTCDSFDAMPGPFPLPADVREGDYIELGCTGAYGAAMASGFNGFGAHETVIVKDDPWPSIFDLSEDAREAAAL